MYIPVDDLRQNSTTISPQSAHETKIQEQQANIEERRARAYEQAIQNDKIRKNRDIFANESKDFLVSQFIYKIVEGCFPEGTDIDHLNMANNIVANFVAEEGANTLLRNFETTSVLLSEAASIINNSYRTIMEHAKEELGPDFTIKSSDLDAYYNKLDQLDYGNMTEIIRARVAKAEEEFIQANINDRTNMEELAQKTKEKLDQVKAKTADLEEDIKQEHVNLYHRNLEKLGNRKKSILEALVAKTGSSVVKDSSLLEQYTLESGKLNTNKVIETAEVMYTVLEAINTANIKKITPEYLSSVIESI